MVFGKLGLDVQRQTCVGFVGGRAIDYNVPCGVFAPSRLDQRSDFDFRNLGGAG